MKQADRTCKRLRSIINAFSYLLSIAFFIGGMVCVCTQVLGRTTGLFMISWTEELSRYCFMGVAIFGSVILVSQNGHLKVEFVQYLFPEAVKKYIHILENIIAILFMSVLCWLSWETAVFNIPRPTPALRISSSIIYFFLTLSSVLMVVQAIINIVLLVLPQNKNCGAQTTDDGGKAEC